jgi:hypothetical protein
MKNTQVPAVEVFRQISQTHYAEFGSSYITFPQISIIAEGFQNLETEAGMC